MQIYYHVIGSALLLFFPTMQPLATEAKGLEERQSERAGSIHELMQEPAQVRYFVFLG